MVQNDLGLGTPTDSEDYKMKLLLLRLLGVMRGGMSRPVPVVGIVLAILAAVTLTSGSGGSSTGGGTFGTLYQVNQFGVPSPWSTDYHYNLGFTAINSSGQIIGTALQIDSNGQLVSYRQAIVVDASHSYSFTAIPLPPNWSVDYDSYSSGGPGGATGCCINASGEIAGFGGNGLAGYPNLNPYGFIGNASGSTPSVVSDGDVTPVYVYGINDSGQVTGRAGSTAFVYTSGTVQELDNPPVGSNGHGSYLVGQTEGDSINNSGSVAGTARIEVPEERYDPTTGSLKTYYTYYNQAFSNVAGVSQLIPMPSGWLGSMANSINEAGNVVGYGGPSGYSQAFLYDTKGNLTIPPLASGMTSMQTVPGNVPWYGSRHINSQNQVVGTAWKNNTWRGWIWDSTHGTRDLNDILVPGSNWTVTDALSIRDDGTILAYGTDGSNPGYALLTTQSETCTPDVSRQFTVTRGGFRYNWSLGAFVESVTLKNNGVAAVTGVDLVLDSLPSSVTLSNGTGITACNSIPTVSPYVSAGTIPAGGQVTLSLQFSDQYNTAISYTTRVLGGGTGMP